MQVQVPAIPGSALPRPALAPLLGEARPAIARHLAAATVLSLILVVGIGGWATFTEISGAVIAPGQLVVE